MSFPRIDSIMLGGKRSPGLAVITGASIPRKWDIQQGYGFSGAVVIYTGDDVAKFTVRITLWLEEHYEEWLTFSNSVLAKPPKGQRPKALGIKHPLLNLAPLFISEVVVEDVTQLEQTEDDKWIAEIRLIQYRKPMPMLGKPNTSIDPAAPPKPTAEDAADREILKMLAQVDELSRPKPVTP